MRGAWVHRGYRSPNTEKGTPVASDCQGHKLVLSFLCSFKRICWVPTGTV